MNKNLLFLLLIFIISNLTSVSQDVSSIDVNEVHHKKVRKYIIARALDKMKDFSLIKASCSKSINEADFSLIEKDFYLKGTLPVVWECYRHSDLVTSLNGRSVQFGLFLSKKTNSIMYADNSAFPEIDTGQVYFLNLKILSGVINVPVAFEIINIDPEQRKIEFSYLDDNKSLGKQTLEFFDNKNGTTKIVHRSYFKSNSLLRDKLLYPFFHKRFVRNFHRKIVCRKSSIVV